MFLAILGGGDKGKVGGLSPPVLISSPASEAEAGPRRGLRPLAALLPSLPTLPGGRTLVSGHLPETGSRSRPPLLGRIEGKNRDA